MGDNTPLDISQMSIKEIQHLTDEELKPVLWDGHRDLFGQTMSNQDLEENLWAVRQGHWAPGLPTVLGGKGAPDTIGL